MPGRPTLALTLAVVLALAGVPPAAAGGPYPVRVYQNLLIPTFDGQNISALLMTPVSADPDERFAALVLPSSWDTSLVEYIVQAHQFAADGVACLQYTARGWFKSTGYIDVAGPSDARDVSTLIDFLLATNLTRADPERVGMAGISYGAGLSLLGAAHDPRVKTAVAMSGWEGILDALDGSDSVSLVWGTILLDTGGLPHGREPPYLKELWAQLKAHENMSGIADWAVPRSPGAYVDVLNARNVPVFISNNLEDRLFKPQFMLDFWEALTVPKRLDLNQGIHATAEIGGLLDIPNNYVWSNVKRWVQYWLQGIDTGIMREPPVNIQHRKLAGLPNPHDYLRFWQWPSPSNVTNQTWTLAPRGTARFGALLPLGANGTEPSFATDSIDYDNNTGMGAGVPVLGPILQVYVDVPIVSFLGLTPHHGSLVWLSPVLETPVYLVGLPTAELWVVPSAPRVQVDAYLYSVDPATKEGILLDHATRSLWDVPPDQPQLVALVFRVLAFNVSAGQQLGLGINLYCDLYEPPSRGPYSVSVLYADGRQPRVYLPVFSP